MKKNIEVRKLTKRFGNKMILESIDMDIPKGEFLSLLGPSGAGKTTFLKILAGILEADSGTVSYPSDIRQSPVLVFQDYQLFPYMSVYNNIAFGLQARHKPRKEIERLVKEIAGTLGILNHLDAYPGQLSGGEKQRCALARALVLNPQVILLDEPFANLDKNLKSDTARLLRRIQQEFNLTLISVTHDQEEAMMLSDTIALLMEGEVKDFGAAEQLYRKPRTLKGAQFLGKVNCIPRECYDYFQLDEENKVYCRPEDLDIRENARGSAIVEQRFFNGRFYKYIIRVKDSHLEVYSSEENLSPGNPLDIVLKEYFQFPEDQDKSI
ncbi:MULTISPECIES: ABC transporter ATP-binding protein [unclassified Oceanispirochaeta]|uniref:ABC transporter ATP-binding protein n=1 Tax=unclassified Oceanispirochaeta TaxID=2635722 RepID=UPI000E093162|nr:MULTISPECIES: ABC transporter ATP-binding protein [unclassified Oceanispirochaeta]MBF9015073.1 ABC transporter ATP-binding protein [Oceanispirochaeta sp. M2]NPD71531.1 ABC transporter ATP-binding protein [Oceanispirochaeta sp. M1]RDG33103.1 ABC transporter ATP-binding protein [Oceanispirochaeta sp. M1]